MYYSSTRNNSIKIESSQAILTGISKEGGLFVPCEFPQISLDTLNKMAKLSYRARAEIVLGSFLTDFTDEKISQMVSSAYGDNFDTENPAPLYKLDDSTFVQELWHGPTCAFKDMALQLLPHLLSASIEMHSPDKEIVILVATSGDTGKAALEGFKNVDKTRIIVFYPKDGVSNIQKLQMISTTGENVTVCAINGNFDDAQTAVKNTFTDNNVIQKLAENNMDFSSANSINWGRLVPQIVYYFSSYCDLLANGTIAAGDKINFTVPTGNFGDILAAYYAAKMGLPVNKLICASNSNNVLTDFINTGIYDMNRQFHTTISPSMDILVSSNLERLIYDLSGNDDKYISVIMDKLKTEGKYKISDEILSQLQQCFNGYYCTEQDTKEAVKGVFENYGYLIDTHTAVAYSAFKKYVTDNKDDSVNVIVSTASPYKFSYDVLSSLKDVEAESDFGILDELNNVSKMPVPKPFDALRTAKVLHNDICEPTDISNYVLKKLGL